MGANNGPRKTVPSSRIAPVGLSHKPGRVYGVVLRGSVRSVGRALMRSNVVRRSTFEGAVRKANTTHSRSQQAFLRALRCACRQGKGLQQPKHIVRDDTPPRNCLPTAR